MDMLEVENFSFIDPRNALTISTPVDHLCGEYRKKREEIEAIAAYVGGCTPVMEYFLSASQLGGNSRLTAEKLFLCPPAIRALDADYWQRAMRLTDVLEYMPADKRNEWHTQIRDHKTPPFEPETVTATLRGLLAQRQAYFADRIDGIFSALSKEHITNNPAGFSKRFIISGVLNYNGHVDSYRCNFIHDLRAVIAIFSGRDAPFAHVTYQDLDRIVTQRQFGEWHSFDGNAFRLRLYMKGTAHLEVNEALSWRLNGVLASLYPSAIPAEFRRKPVKTKKQPKEVELDLNLLSFKTLEILDAGHIDFNKRSIWFHSVMPTPPVERVLSYIGGVKKSASSWEFDYDITHVLYEIQRTGSLPEQRSHQYFPTPESVARYAVEFAGIKEGDQCLEPSAGQAGIAQFMPIDRTTCVEISPLHCTILESKGFQTICTDFLKWQPSRIFQKIVMNPPYSDGRALAHLEHAASLLDRQGVLVCVLPESKKGLAMLPDFDHEWGESFHREFSGTGISVCVARLTRKGAKP